MSGPTIGCLTATAPGRPPEFLERCKHYVERFELPFRCEVYHHVEAGLSMPANLLGLLDLCDDCEYDYVAIIEDDDWYGPAYLAEMISALQFSEASIIGADPTVYYYIPTGKFMILRSWNHCSLFATAGVGKLLTAALRTACKKALAGNHPSVDLELWRLIAGSPLKGETVRTVNPSAVGIKHGYGPVLGSGHRLSARYRRDEGYDWLQTVVGYDDSEFYLSLVDKYSPDLIQQDDNMEDVL